MGDSLGAIIHCTPKFLNWITSHLPQGRLQKGAELMNKAMDKVDTVEGLMPEDIHKQWTDRLDSTKEKLEGAGKRPTRFPPKRIWILLVDSHRVVYSAKELMVYAEVTSAKVRAESRSSSGSSRSSNSQDDGATAVTTPPRSSSPTELSTSPTTSRRHNIFHDSIVVLGPSSGAETNEFYRCEVYMNDGAARQPAAPSALSPASTLPEVEEQLLRLVGETNSPAAKSLLDDLKRELTRESLKARHPHHGSQSTSESGASSASAAGPSLSDATKRDLGHLAEGFQSMASLPSEVDVDTCQGQLECSDGDATVDLSIGDSAGGSGSDSTGDEGTA